MMISFSSNSFTVFESQIYKTTSTVLKTNDGIIIVDPTLLPSEIKEIRDYVNSLKEDLPIYLIITHSDWDHIVGVGAFPEATIIASKSFTTKNAGDLIEQVKSFDDEYYIERNYPIVFPKVDIVITKDGDKLQIGSTTLTFYEAKGHTDDGIFTIVEPEGIFIAGDYLSDVEFPFIYSSSKDYIKTLEKIDEILKNHKIHLLIPGHGHVANGQKEILQRKQNSLTYIVELQKAIETNSAHDHLITSYPFQRALKKCHEENVLFLKKENLL